MFFNGGKKGKKLRGGITSTLGALTLVLLLQDGCALHEGPPPEKQKTPPMKLSCLAEIQDQLLDYVDGKMESADTLDQMVECAKTALETFRDRTHGLKKNHFTAHEIRNFLQRYFISGKFTITDELLLEAMRVKQAIIGGRSEEFSTADIDYGIGIIRRVGGILKVLHPQMPMGLKRFEAMNEQELDRAIMDIDSAADLFAAIITEKGITYSFSDCERFLTELIKQFPDAKPLQNMREHLDFASAVKALLISPDRSRDEFAPQDWKILLEDGARWMGVGLKVLNLQKNNVDLMRGRARVRFGSIAEEALGLMGRMVGRHNGVIKFKLLDELIDELSWEGKLGDFTIQKSTIKQTIRAVVLHPFSEVDRSANGRAALGLGLGHLKSLDRLIKEILQGAAYIEAVYALQTGRIDFPKGATIPRNLLAKITDAEIEDIAKKTGGGATLIQAAKSLRSTYTGIPAMLAGDASEIIFSGDLDQRARSYADAFHGVWLKPMFKRTLRGYLDEGDIQTRGLECWERKTQPGVKCVESGLTEKEFKGFISDFWPLLLDFKFVWTTSSIPRDSKKRFMEAALFTPISNGDDFISMDEGLAMVMYMISAKPLGARLHDAAAAVCKHGPLDESGQPTLEPVCYRRVVFDFSARNADSKKLWGTMPLMMKYYDTLSSSEQAELKKLIEEPMRHGGYQRDVYFDSGESDTLAMMFHYIESLYNRFDKDPFDMKIDRSEAMMAYPVFRKTLAGIAEMDEDAGMLKDVFTWLLAKGRPPVDPEYHGLKKFIKSVPFLIWAATNPKFEAPRSNLISVFGQIGKMAGTSGSNPPTEEILPPGGPQPGVVIPVNLSAEQLH